MCAERPKGQEAKLGMLNGCLMSKSSVLLEPLRMSLTEIEDICNLHKNSKNINETHLPLCIDKHTAGIQIC